MSPVLLYLLPGVFKWRTKGPTLFYVIWTPNLWLNVRDKCSHRKLVSIFFHDVTVSTTYHHLLYFFYTNIVWNKNDFMWNWYLFSFFRVFFLVFDIPIFSNSSIIIKNKFKPIHKKWKKSIETGAFNWLFLSNYIVKNNFRNL